MAESLEFLFRMLWLLDAAEIVAYGVFVAIGLTAVAVALIRWRARKMHQQGAKGNQEQ